MRVLIVDDNVERLGKIVVYLQTVGVSRECIEERRTVHDARSIMRSERFDLLLLDLMLPNRVEDVPAVANSLALLSEVTERETLYKPRKVVGLTAYSEALQTASASFVDSTWTIVETSEVQDEWLPIIGNCVKYLDGETGQRVAEGYGIDLLILTALADPEMAAIERLPWHWQAKEPLDDVHFVRRGRVDVEGGSFEVVAAVAERMGMVSAAVLATKLILAFRPRLCVMPGICAGIRGRTELGDIMFAEAVWDYQSGKITSSDEGGARFEMSPHQISVDASLVGKIDELAADSELLGAIRRGWADAPRQDPRIVRAPVATGSAVLADSNTAQRVIEQNRKLRAVEMELYGLYLSASQAAKPRPLFFGLKSVCDFADAEKNDAFQAYAAYTSASVLKAFVERYLPSLVGRR